MSDAVTTPWLAPRDQTAALTLTEPQPFAAPVLISDVATPLAGETLLSLLWKRLDRSD